MNKKPKRGSIKSRREQPPDIDRLLDRAVRKLTEGEYDSALDLARRVLALPEATPEQCASALSSVGIALIVQKKFDQAYAAITQAVTLAPDDPDLWYNRSAASRYTMRMGQSQRDLERALALGVAAHTREDVRADLAETRKIVKDAIAMRGRGFTLDKLIEQEELFQVGVGLMAEKDWPAGEQVFRQVIALGDCLPQPWGNLGACLMMQGHYDDAEAALRRALVVDPSYDLARQNLAALPAIRRAGLPAKTLIRSPFEDVKLQHTLLLHDE